MKYIKNTWNAITNFFTKYIKPFFVKSIQYIKKAGAIIAAFFASIKKENIPIYIFVILILGAMVNITFMTFHLLDDEYNYPILGYSYVDAITPNQDINGTLYTDIVRVKEFDDSTINNGDYVVIESDFNTTEHWVEEVLSVDKTFKTLEVTYDNDTSITVPYDDVYGTYVKEANIFGTLYFTAKFSRGYTLLLVSHAFVLMAYYLAWIDRKE